MKDPFRTLCAHLVAAGAKVFGKQASAVALTFSNDRTELQHTLNSLTQAGQAKEVFSGTDIRVWDFVESGDRIALEFTNKGLTVSRIEPFKEEWLALKHPSLQENEWCVTPTSHFEEFGTIPDKHSGLNIPGMEEVDSHTFRILNGGDGKELLKALGFTVSDTLEDCRWYFQRPGYAEELVARFERKANVEQ